MVGSLLVAFAIVGVGWWLGPASEGEGPPAINTRLSIRQIAPQLDATGKSLAKELGLSPNVSMATALVQLQVSQESLDRAVAHLWSHRGRNLKYFVIAAIVLWSLCFLVRLGRPDSRASSGRAKLYPQAVYFVTLAVAVVVCGFALGKSPNPMEGAVKVFKAMAGLQSSALASVLALLFFLVLSIVGNKLICGWACPFGGLQEMIYSLPLLRRLKRRKVPLAITNTVRIALFVLMLLVLFGLIGSRAGFVLYHPINPFNLFNFEFESFSILLSVVLTLGLSLAVYRPFCQFICPFGLVSWFAERFSLYRVRVSREKCNRCGACAAACPTGSARDFVEARAIAAECYSCARCLRVCPHGALTYSLPSRRRGCDEMTGAEPPRGR